jgi:hypothetical protein
LIIKKALVYDLKCAVMASNDMQWHKKMPKELNLRVGVFLHGSDRGVSMRFVKNNHIFIIFND